VVAVESVAPDVVLAGRLEWGVAHVLHAPADGTLRAIGAHHLEAVVAGQRLFEIGAPHLEDEIGRARLALLQARLQQRQIEGMANGPEMLQQRAALAEADSQIAQLRRRTETLRNLVAAGIAPRQELVDMTERIEELGTRRFFLQQLLEELERRQSPEARRVVEDQVALAEATLARLEAAQRDLVVSSPGQGRLIFATPASGGGDLLRQPGEAVRRGERIAVIADPSRPEVAARADEVDAGRIAPGAPTRVRFSLDARHDYAGTVREIRRAPRPGAMAPSMEDYLVTLEVWDVPETLLPGATALVRVATPARPALMVPLRFVRLGGGRAEVRRVNPSTGAVEALDVLPGVLIGERVEISGELRAGDVLMALP
jgi:multidrug resistance efflux pump